MTRNNLVLGRNQFNTAEAKNMIIFKKGGASLVKSPGATTVVHRVQHNLGYVPAYMIWASCRGDDLRQVGDPTPLSVYEMFTTVPTLNLWFNFPSYVYVETVSAEINSFELVITYSIVDTLGTSTAADRTAKIKYLIFREKAK